MEETLIRMYEATRNEMYIITGMFVVVTIAWYVQLRIDRIDRLYRAIKETINTEDHPEQYYLQAITTFRKFRKEEPEFQCAVLDKLKAYDIVPTAIEKTMTPEQLYKAHNPLWMSGINVEAIRIIFLLEGKLGRELVANECMDEFMLDYQNGMEPIAALEKQLQNMITREESQCSMPKSTFDH
jgi:hypothetical protein